jgi:hypothetical protein
LVTTAALAALAIARHDARRRGTTVGFCLSAPLTGKVTYVAATSTGTLGQIRGEVGGLPPNTYVEAGLLTATALPERAYLDNGLPGPDVVGVIGLWTSGHGPERIAETVAVGPGAKVEEIVFRARNRLTHDLRPYGPAAQRC